MHLRNPIVVFLVRLTLVYVLLIIPWPGGRQLYVSGFRAVAEMIFDTSTEKRQVYFETPDKTPQVRNDTRFVIVNPALMHADGSGPVRNFDFSAVIMGWQPTALLIALIIATPLPWPRRRRALLFGGLCLHGYMVVTLGAWIWAESATLFVANWTPLWNAIAIGVQTLGIQLVFAAPVVIWMLVTFRGEDKPGNIALFA